MAVGPFPTKSCFMSWDPLAKIRQRTKFWNSSWNLTWTGMEPLTLTSFLRWWKEKAQKLTKWRWVKIDTFVNSKLWIDKSENWQLWELKNLRIDKSENCQSYELTNLWIDKSDNWQLWELTNLRIDKSHNWQT